MVMKRERRDINFRAYFMGVLIGMAKSAGYTKTQFLREVRVCWQHVKD